MLNRAIDTYFMYVNCRTGEESLRFKSYLAMSRVMNADYEITPNTIVKCYEVYIGIFGEDISIPELLSRGFETVSPDQEINDNKMYDVLLDLTNKYYIIRRSEIINEGP